MQQTWNRQRKVTKWTRNKQGMNKEWKRNGKSTCTGIFQNSWNFFLIIKVYQSLIGLDLNDGFGVLPKPEELWVRCHVGTIQPLS